MQGAQKEAQNGRSETLPRTVHRMVAEEVAAVADNEEAGSWRRQGSAAVECVWSLKSQESWSSAGRTGPLAGLQRLPVGLQAKYGPKADLQWP